MAKENDDIKHNKRIIEALDKAIEDAPMGDNLFFKAMQNKLIQIRERFKEEVGLQGMETEEQDVPATFLGRIARRSGLIEVYVSLYNADGTNIPRWENILHTLDRQIVSRPTYRDEKDVKSVIRAASNKNNEAYVALFVREEDLIKHEEDKIPKDKFGNELIVVQSKAVNHDNITRFVHSSGNYEYENRKLVWQGAAEFI